MFQTVIMQRRQFIKGIASVATGAVLAPAVAIAGAENRERVMTVLGPVSREKLGFTLTHEHILVDFVGAENIRSGGYDYDLVSARALPHLMELKNLGMDTMVECTPAFIGRDASLMKRLSEATGINLITNTGYYGARDGFFVPEAAQAMSPRQLATIWIHEARNGIGNTGILPGFIKTAVNPGPLGELDQKLIKASAIAHRETGLTIHSHTGKTPISAYQQIEILKEQGIHPSAWVWVHATGVQDLDDLRPAFEAGAWVSFDNLRPNQQSAERMLRCLLYARNNGWLGQVLVSHDAGWFDPAKPDGGEHRPYTGFWTHLLPVAEKAGIDAADLELITRKNAFEAMKVHKRLLF